MPAPILTDPEGSFRLRFPTDVDLDGIYECVRESITEIAPWMDWCHPHYSRDETEIWLKQLPDFWKARQNFIFLVERRDGRPLGTCALSHPNWKHRLANLGFWIRSSETGKGYATGAGRLLARWGLESLELNRLEIIMALENHPSRRVAEKLGAHFEGVLRNRLQVGPQILDAFSYSLSPRDLV